MAEIIIKDAENETGVVVAVPGNPFILDIIKEKKIFLIGDKDEL